MHFSKAIAYACAIFLGIDEIAAYALKLDTSITTPHQSKHNHKGSMLCGELGEHPLFHGKNYCQRAAERYKDEENYLEYTSSTFPYSEGGEQPHLGCAVFYQCDDHNDLKNGITGAQIKHSFNLLYAEKDVKTCGTIYLTNGCRVTANACFKCRVTNGHQLNLPPEDDFPVPR